MVESTVKWSPHIDGHRSGPGKPQLQINLLQVNSRYMQGSLRMYIYDHWVQLKKTIGHITDLRFAVHLLELADEHQHTW